MSDYSIRATATAGILPRAQREVVRRIGPPALLAAAYYGAARLGYALDFAGPVAAIVWLPVGVAVAFLYLGGVGLWPGVVVGDLLANDYSALPLGSAVGQTCGNLLEVVVAALLLRRLLRGRSPLDSPAGVGALAVAIAVGAAVSASVGTLSLALGDVIRWSALAGVWRTWWLGDSCGALLVVPLAVAWRARPTRAPPAAVAEGAVALAAVAATTELAFRTTGPRIYVVFPALAWAALRFGQRGATLALFVTVAIAVWNTTHALGPFSFDALTRSLLDVQLYIAVAALSTVAAAAVFAERRELAYRLGAARAGALAAADAERHRLERNLHDGAQQRLLALAFTLSRAAERSPPPAAAPDLLRRAEQELLEIYAELRSLAHGLDPVVLASGGLGGAIRSLAAHSPVPATVLVRLPPRRFEAQVESAAYFLIAEALANVQKHAHASSVRVSAGLDRRGLVVEVCDDGLGGAAELPGSGLAGLRERVEVCGGTFDVDSVPRRGTRVAAAFPVHAAARLQLHRSRTTGPGSVHQEQLQPDEDEAERKVRCNDRDGGDGP